MVGLIVQGTQTSGQVLQFSPALSTLFSSPNSIGTQNVRYNHYVGDSTDIHQHSSTSPGTAEVNSDLEGSTNSSEYRVRQALKKLEEQLSIGEDNVNSLDPLYVQNESLDSLQFLDIDNLAQPATVYQRPENNKLERCYGGYIGAEYHSNNLMVVKNGSGTPKLHIIDFR